MSQELKPIKGSGWLWFLGLVIIIFGFSFALIPDVKKAKPQKPTISQSVTQQQWQLCWEKKPSHEGKSGIRSRCLPAKLEKRNKNHIIISYSEGRGVQEGTSTDGVSYNGKWEDSTGWGYWHLRFVSSDTAFGWSDDEGKGEKAPNVFRKK